MASIAILIKLDSPGPVFHRAVRVGKGAKNFNLYKFRSMVSGAASQGPGITSQGDPRITRIGRWLRKFKLDELPQLINVMKGEMSLVGPRPEDPRYVALYNPEQRRILEVLPGITSAASIYYRHEEQMLSGLNWEISYIQNVMPEKLRMDLDYLEQSNFFSDLILLWRTFLAIFK